MRIISKLFLSSALVATVSVGVITGCGLGKSSSADANSETNAATRGLPGSGEAWSRPGLANASLGVVLTGQPAKDLFSWLKAHGGEAESLEWGQIVSNPHFRCTHNATRATPYECAFSVVKDGSVVKGL